MAQNEIKIAVIIPLYYKSFVTKKCLESLKNQTKKDNLIIYLINDCSPNTDCEYQDLIIQYKQYFPIKYYKTKQNCGQGLTRQLGLDKCKEDFILFIDQDDYLYDNTVIEQYIKAIQEDDYVIITGLTIKIDPVSNKTTYEGENTFTGNVFNKKFLNKYNIIFSKETTRFGEDLLFNTKTYHYALLHNKKIKHIQNILYVQYHSMNQDSITWDGNKGEFKDIFFDGIIINMAERMKFFESCKNELTARDKIIIFHEILFNFYKNGYILLYLLEQYGFSPYIQKDKNTIKQYCLYLINIINKNKKIFDKYKTIELPSVFRECKEQIPYISWEDFCDTIEDRFNKM